MYFTKKGFNERLKGIRNKFGYTQEQLSAILGMKRNTYARYETDTNPSIEVLALICHTLSCSADYLIFGPKPEHNEEEEK